MEEYNNYGYRRRYVRGHNRPWNYIGRKKSGNYFEIHVPREHPYRNKQGCILEHRFVMEQSLGRYLRPEERVHHIDHNPSNNNIENLQLIPTNSEHTRLHSFGRRRTFGQRCPKCNSDNVIRDGLRYHKRKQGWHCQNCFVKFRTPLILDNTPLQR